MLESTACGRIAECPDEAWKATVTAFRDYLAQCRSALDASRKVYEGAMRRIDTDAAKEHSTKAASKGTKLPRDAASHRSEHVYLLSATASREITLPDAPVSSGYRPPLWGAMDEIDDTRKRKRKAA